MSLRGLFSINLQLLGFDAARWQKEHLVQFPPDLVRAFPLSIFFLSCLWISHVSFIFLIQSCAFQDVLGRGSSRVMEIVLYFLFVTLDPKAAQEVPITLFSLPTCPSTEGGIV